MSSYSLILFWMFVRLLLVPLFLHLRLFQWRPLLGVEGVVVFTAAIVTRLDMWRFVVTERRRLRLAMVVVLHKVLVVLGLEVLRGVLLVLRHRRSSCCCVTSLPLHLLELLVLLPRRLHSQVLLLLLSLLLTDHIPLFLRGGGETKHIPLLLQVLFHGFFTLVHLFI
uniref:Uncharacterized protein n=1 Tax=Arundo donax TaxID=35708 RepID=A0A0A9D245_ARUDO